LLCDLISGIVHLERYYIFDQIGLKAILMMRTG